MSLWNDVFKKLSIPFLIAMVIAWFYWVGLSHPDWHERMAIHPLDPSHWLGIFTVPLVHANTSHLWNNLISLFGLSALLYLNYSRIANMVMALLWVGTGILMYFITRPEFYHIGASGVVYALIFFLITAGFIVRRKGPLAIAFAVGIYYGGSFWGLFPLEQGVSWDGHISGAIAGFFAALVFRNKIKAMFPPDPLPHWMNEPEDSDEYKKFDQEE